MVRAALGRDGLREVRVNDLPPIFRDTALVHLTRRTERSTVAQDMIESLVLEARSQSLELTLA
jgi:hypothetical protein